MPTDSFNTWQWDREQFDAGKSQLSIQRHGHTVSFDRFGVSIDGRRIVNDDLKRTPGDRGFAVRPDGTVLYRQQVVATIAAPTGPAPGQVTVYRESDPHHQPTAADRNQPDTTAAVSQRAPDHGEEELDL